jgi:hypothetical protein
MHQIIMWPMPCTHPGTCPQHMQFTIIMTNQPQSILLLIITFKLPYIPLSPGQLHMSYTAMSSDSTNLASCRCLNVVLIIFSHTALTFLCQEKPMTHILMTYRKKTFIEKTSSFVKQ